MESRHENTIGAMSVRISSVFSFPIIELRFWSRAIVVCRHREIENISSQNTHDLFEIIRKSGTAVMSAKILQNLENLRQLGDLVNYYK